MALSLCNTHTRMHEGTKRREEEKVKASEDTGQRITLDTDRFATMSLAILLVLYTGILPRTPSVLVRCIAPAHRLTHLSQDTEPLHAHAATNCQGQSQLSLVFSSLSLPLPLSSICLFHVKTTRASHADIFLPHFTVISLEPVVTFDGRGKSLLPSCTLLRCKRKQFTECAVCSVHLTLHQGVLSYKCVIDTL